MIFRIVIILCCIKHMKFTVISFYYRACIASIISIFIFTYRQYNTAIFYIYSILCNQKVPTGSVTILILCISFSLIMKIKYVKFTVMCKRYSVTYPTILRSVENLPHLQPRSIFFLFLCSYTILFKQNMILANAPKFL